MLRLFSVYLDVTATNGLIESAVIGGTTNSTSSATNPDTITTEVDFDGMILALLICRPGDGHDFCIESQAVHDAVLYLIDHAPPQMHLVIVTRVNPPLPLARLRGSGRLNEFREEARIGVAFNLGYTDLWLRAGAKAAQRWFSEAEAIAARVHSLTLTLAAMSGLAQTQREQGRLREAESTLQRGLHDDSRSQDWQALQTQARTAVYRRLARLGVNDFPQHLKFEVAFTPTSWFNRYNVAKGAAFGSLSHNFRQVGYLRLQNRNRRYQNLYFVGGSTHPGNGLPLVLLSACLTTERILKEADSRQSLRAKSFAPSQLAVKGVE